MYVTTPSACPWVARLGFGWSACDLFALFRLGFPSASGELSLNLATHSLLVGPFYKKYAVTLRLLLFIGTKFQDLFHSPSGVLLTFPSQYLFAIDLTHFLVLESGLPRFTPAFTWPMLLKNTLNRTYRGFKYGTFTLFGPPSQVVLLPCMVCWGFIRPWNMSYNPLLRNAVWLGT